MYLACECTALPHFARDQENIPEVTDHRVSFLFNSEDIGFKIVVTALNVDLIRNERINIYIYIYSRDKPIRHRLYALDRE